MPPRRRRGGPKKKPKISQKQRGEQLEAHLNQIRSNLLTGIPQSVAQFNPTSGGGGGGGHCVSLYSQVKLSPTDSHSTSKQVWISFSTGKGERAYLKMGAKPSPQRLGAALAFCLHEAFVMEWDQLTEERIPDEIKLIPNQNAQDRGGEDDDKEEKNEETVDEGGDVKVGVASTTTSTKKGEEDENTRKRKSDKDDDEDDNDDNNNEKEEEFQDEFEFIHPALIASPQERQDECQYLQKLFRGADIKWITISSCNTATRSPVATKDELLCPLLLRPWSNKTNHSDSILPEDESLLRIQKGASLPQVGFLARGLVELSLCRKESAIHPNADRYQDNRPRRWAK